MAGSDVDPFRLSPAAAGPLRRRLLGAAERMLGLDHLQRLYDRRPGDCDTDRFLEWSFDALGVRVDAAEEDIGQVPADGPLVIVANHPFGGIEGIALARLLRRRRTDVRILANYVLRRISELRELFLFVDPFETTESVQRNLAPMRRALRWVRDGHALVVFPAGEVSHLDLRRRRVEDPTWNRAAAAIVRRARCPVLPIYFEGRNSLPFQLLGLLHPRLRTAMLAREMIGRRGETIAPRIGRVIPFRQIASHDDVELTSYLRLRTHILCERAPRSGQSPAPVQPRVTPRGAASIVPASPTELLAREVDRLPGGQMLLETADGAVFFAQADQIPEVLHEIGRLREITFRAVGEGTGREIDLDEFDSRYHHLFIWNRAARQIVGAYRIGKTDELIRERGIDGLYTSTLFDFEPRLFDAMGPALEMGRSFIRPEHQKSYTGLMLLWKGIGHFVLRDPRYTSLFGPVSISAEYRSVSQQLIVAFLEQNRYAHDWARWVHPHEPCRRDRARDYRSGLAKLRDLDDVSAFIAEIEADQKGVPILLKQYLRLGGRLLGFNVDPAFSNVLDVLIMVDLRQTAPKILSRYMGRDGARSFLRGQVLA